MFANFLTLIKRWNPTSSSQLLAGLSDWLPTHTTLPQRLGIKALQLLPYSLELLTLEKPVIVRTVNHFSGKVYMQKNQGLLLLQSGC
jgi:hypothetical protein